MLPDEVWEVILEKIDYYNLRKLKTVSKRWDMLITRVIARNYKWYEKCLKEIPEKWWSSLPELQTHPEICCDDFHKARNHPTIWMSMYRSWIGWRNLTKNRSQKIIRLFDSSLDVSLPSNDKQIGCLETLELCYQEIFVASNILDGRPDDDLTEDDDDTTVYVYEILPDQQLKHLNNFLQRDEDFFFSIDIFKPCVVAFVEGSTRSQRQTIGFAVFGRACKRYQVYIGLSAHVTATHYHVGLLMLGLASGEVRIFNDENDDCLGKLNFESLESMTLKLTQYNIEHIKITEYNSIQYLVVAADRDLILVKFG